MDRLLGISSGAAVCAGVEQPDLNASHSGFVWILAAIAMSGAPASSRLHTYFVVKEPDVPDRILVFDTQEVSIGRAKVA